MFKENIYELIIKYPNLNDKILHKYGYSDDDINNFKRRNILSKLGDIYVVNNMDDLLKYYNSISRSKDYSKQAKIMDLALSIQPNHYNGLKQRFFLALKLNDPETALYCFKKIYPRFKKQCRFDALIQLYLLSKLIYVGDELNKELETLSVNDIKIPDKDTRYENIDLKNKARVKMVNYEFEDAYNMVYAENKPGRKLTFQELTLVTLLNRVIANYRNGHNYIECINQGRYDDAVYSLSQKSELSYYDKLLSKLLDYIINPPSEVFIDYNHKPGLWESIEANDFDNALELSIAYNEDKGIDDSTSPMSNLLRDIIDMLSVYVNCDNLEDDRLYCVYYISNLIDRGYSFEDALNLSDLDMNKKLYVILIYAKEAYRIGNIEFADKLMNMYKVINGIDDTYADLYQEIIDDKEELPNKPSELNRVLSMPNKGKRN